MATKYVRKTGSDSNNGNSAAAAYLTVQKAMDNVSTGGDAIYVGAGVYRQLLKPTITPTAMITLIADSDGFNTGDAGEVILSGYTTNDTTAPATTDALLDGNGKNFWSWQGFTMVGANNVNGSILNATSSIHDWQFIGCTFIDPAVANQRTPFNFSAQAADLTANILFSRCRFAGSAQTYIVYTATQSATADYDVGLTVQDCIVGVFGSSFLGLSTTGANTGGRAGGALIKRCTFINGMATGTSFGVTRVGANWSFSIPARVIGSWMVMNDVGPPVSTGAVGNVWEDGNVGATDPSGTANWFIGSISKYGTYAPLINLGQDAQYNAMRPRRLGEPLAGAPALGFCPFADVSIGVPGTAADDSTIGTVTWGTPNNALVVKELAGEAYATAALTAAAISHYLKLTNWTFHPAIPSTATILGLRIEINRKGTVNADVSWNSVKLFDGVAVAYQSEWVSHILPNNSAWGTGDAQTQFGSSTDQWGTTLTPTILNNSGTGVGLATTSAGTATADVDGVRMHVYWVDTSALPTDVTNVQRPCGGGSASFAAGAYERHDTAARDSVVKQASTSSAKLVGPGDQIVFLPVDAVSHSVSFYLRYDSPYAGTRPSVTLLEGVTAGAAQTITATTGANGAWELESFSAISPSAKGVVAVRFQSYDTNGAGPAWIDTAG